LNNFYTFKIFLRKFGNNYPFVLDLFYQVLYIGIDILWGDEIFGRHALSSRGWGQSAYALWARADEQDKRKVEPTCSGASRDSADQG
jgi:hypothetical protein